MAQAGPLLSLHKVATDLALTYLDLGVADDHHITPTRQYVSQPYGSWIVFLTDKPDRI